MLLTGQTENTPLPGDLRKLYDELTEAVQRYVPAPTEMEEDDLSYQLVIGLALRKPESDDDYQEAINLLTFLLEEHGWHGDEAHQQAIDELVAKASLISPSPNRLRKTMLEQIRDFCGLEQQVAE